MACNSRLDSVQAVVGNWLIGQTRQLLGKNLYDVMKLLAPSHADGARIFVGGDAAFTVPVSGIPASEAACGADSDAEERVCDAGVSKGCPFSGRKV